MSFFGPCKLGLAGTIVFEIILHEINKVVSCTPSSYYPPSSAQVMKAAFKIFLESPLGCFVFFLQEKFVIEIEYTVSLQGLKLDNTKKYFSYFLMWKFLCTYESLITPLERDEGCLQISHLNPFFMSIVLLFHYICQSEWTPFCNFLLVLATVLT